MSILLTIFVNNLLPVFIVIGAGIVLGVTLHPDVKAVSRTTFYKLTPCLIFSGLLNTPLTGAETQQVAAFAILATLAMGIVAWLIATALGWRDKRRRALVLPVLVINTGNFGLSVVLFAFGASHREVAGQQVIGPPGPTIHHLIVSKARIVDLLALASNLFDGFLEGRDQLGIRGGAERDRLASRDLQRHRLGAVLLEVPMAGSLALKVLAGCFHPSAGDDVAGHRCDDDHDGADHHQKVRLDPLKYGGHSE